MENMGRKDQYNTADKNKRVEKANVKQRIQRIYKGM
jgi:hypothetical protein